MKKRTKSRYQIIQLKDCGFVVKGVTISRRDGGGGEGEAKMWLGKKRKEERGRKWEGGKQKSKEV